MSLGATLKQASGGARRPQQTPGGIIPFRWAASSRFGGRHHPVTTGDIISFWWATSPGISMRRRAGAAIGPDHAAKIEPVDHLDHKARQMLLGQPLVHRRRQKKRRPAPGNCPSPATTLRRGINETILAKISAVGLSPTGC